MQRIDGTCSGWGPRSMVAASCRLVNLPATAGSAHGSDRTLPDTSVRNSTSQRCGRGRLDRLVAAAYDLHAPMHADQRRQHALLLGLICLIAIVAYQPVWNAGFIWDDDQYVEHNGALRGSLWAIWSDPWSLPQYYPLVHSMFWLEYRLWGLDPTGYHLVNLALHLLGVLLLYRIVRSLALPGALFAAALFALHPVMVESVAWVTERKNVLSMVCYPAERDLLPASVRARRPPDADRSAGLADLERGVVVVLRRAGQQVGDLLAAVRRVAAVLLPTRSGHSPGDRLDVASGALRRGVRVVHQPRRVGARRCQWG